MQMLPLRVLVTSKLLQKCLQYDVSMMSVKSLQIVTYKMVQHFFKQKLKKMFSLKNTAFVRNCLSIEEWKVEVLIFKLELRVITARTV